MTVRFSDGTAQMAEVSCGGGYLAQSTTDLFFGAADGARVERVDVTWPTGATTSSTPAAQDGLIEQDGLIIVSQRRE